MSADVIELRQAPPGRPADSGSRTDASAQDVAQDGLARLLARLQPLAARTPGAEALGLEEVLQCTAALLAGQHGYTAQELQHLLALPIARTGR